MPEKRSILALIARLRAAEARADDAERRGWIMGRDAAVELAQKYVEKVTSISEDGSLIRMTGNELKKRIAALTPPQEPSTNG